MRKKLIPAVAAVLAVISCNKEAPVTPATKFEFTATTEDTKTALDGNKVRWNEGDLISINGAKYKAYPRESGTKADFEYIDGSVPMAPYTAIYPFEGAEETEPGVFSSVIPTVQQYTAGSFCSGSFPMMAKSEGKDLVFKNVGAALKITPSTGWKDLKIRQLKVSAAECLAGDIRIEWPEGGLPAASGADANSVTLDCGEGVDFNTPLFLSIAPGVYSSLTIEIITDNGGVYSETASGTYNIGRSQLASFTVGANEIICDLSNNIADTPSYPKPETANCYLIKKMGAYSFPVTIKGNGVSPDGSATAIEGAEKVKVLLQDGSLAATAFRLSDDKSRMLFETDKEKSLTAGTAIVGVLDSENKVLWSWTIWACPGICEQTVGNYTFLDRNIGAYVKGYTESGFDGFYYQYGRKDPFPQGNDKGRINAIPGWAYLRTTEISVETAIQNPRTWLEATDNATSGIDWCSTTRYDWWDKGRKASSGDRETVKTMYDPCPVGYKVPGRTAMLALKAAAASKISSSNLAIGDWKLAATGFRTPGASYNGVNANHGSSVNVWTSHAYSTSYAYTLSSDKTETVQKAYSRRYALPVLPQKN